MFKRVNKNQVGICVISTSLHVSNSSGDNWSWQPARVIYDLGWKLGRKKLGRKGWLVDIEIWSMDDEEP